MVDPEDTWWVLLEFSRGILASTGFADKTRQQLMHLLGPADRREIMPGMAQSPPIDEGSSPARSPLDWIISHRPFQG